MADWLSKLAIHYILTKLAEGTGAVDWAGLTKEVEALEHKVVPPWARPMVDGVVEGTVKAVEAALKDTADLEALVEDLRAQDWAKAVADLEALVLKAAKPAA